MNLFYGIPLIALLTTSCLSPIKGSLLEQIENRTETTEELFEKYEEINTQLVEAIAKENYSYSKLLKTKNSLRAINYRITRRNEIISKLQKPKTTKAPATPTKVINTQKERLATFVTQQKALSLETAKWLSTTKALSAEALTLRKTRNKTYQNYTESRLELKTLKNKKPVQ
jgi:hypothetical protein